MYNIFVVFVSLLLAMACSNLARKRGYNPNHWFIAGAIFGILALLALYLLPVRKKQVATVPPKPLPSLTPLEPEHMGKLWYFLDEEKQQFGPMSLDGLNRAWKEGKVREKTYVWNEGMANWQPLQAVIKAI